MPHAEWRCYLANGLPEQASEVANPKVCGVWVSAGIAAGLVSALWRVKGGFRVESLWFRAG